MPNLISAEFKSRRDAEMAVEHIVQEHAVSRDAIRVGPAGDENTAGSQAARADIENGHLKSGNDGEPALAGNVRVSVEVNESMTTPVVASLKIYNGEIAA